MNQPKILLLNFEPERSLSDALRSILETKFLVECHCQPFPETEDVAAEQLSDQLICATDAALIFVVVSGDAWRRAERLLKSAGRCCAPRPAIAVAQDVEPEQILTWLRLWATDFIVPPLSAEEVLPRALRLLRRTEEEDELCLTLKERMGLRQLVGQSKAFVAEIGKLPLIARCDVRVLIQGETGTGKELCARAIHYLSPRSSGPFIPVNCGAIPAELVENELFGHERGAYTGATTAHAGMIQEAEGGTLFLDEIDCLPPVAQVKLLRFIQEKEYRPLGSTKVRHADVRVISATNADTEQAVKEGKLRRDFYYRLNVVPLLLPPLRERRCDIELLAQHFLSKFVSEFNSSVSSIAHAALRKLASYDWPGNVRELEHVMERAVTLAEQSVLQAEDIVLPTESAPLVNDSFSQAKARMIDRFEREYIREMLIAYCGNITKAALAAKKNRRAFWQLIRKHHINVHEFKSDTF